MSVQTRLQIFEGLEGRAKLNWRKRLYVRLQEQLRKVFGRRKLVKHANLRILLKSLAGPNRTDPLAPPLKLNGNTFTDPSGKSSVLRRALLERMSGDKGISLKLEQIVSRVKLHLDVPVDIDEIEQCLLSSTNTAPGIDGITTNILLACWDCIKHAALLYHLSIRQVPHPRAFCTTEVMFLPKPNKRDLSSPKSWRPIALLSCLGKVPESLIAKRISRMAIIQKVLSQQPFGALPKSSATDLFGCLAHEIEKALSQRKKALLLTMDVKDAFGTILPGRLK